MSSTQVFTEEVSSAMGNYIYRLIDPRNGETFYVGKGRGNRVFEHAKAASNFVPADDEDEIVTKLGRIRAIENSGLKVIHVIHRHDIPEDAIYEVEAALIDAYPGLSNVQGGHSSGAKGPMNTDELITKYGLPTFSAQPNDRLVLINVNRLESLSRSRDEIYKQTQLSWKISAVRANRADYVLAVVRGVIVGAFEVDSKGWQSATHANFPERVPQDVDKSDRMGFHGSPAPDEIWDRYVGERGKRIAIEGMKHIQNPIRYWNL